MVSLSPEALAKLSKLSEMGEGALGSSALRARSRDRTDPGSFVPPLYSGEARRGPLRSL
jgi:hypothetical protein